MQGATESFITDEWNGQQKNTEYKSAYETNYHQNVFLLFNSLTLLSYLPGDPGPEIYEFVVGGGGGGGSTSGIPYQLRPMFKCNFA